MNLTIGFPSDSLKKSESNTVTVSLKLQLNVHDAMENRAFFCHYIDDSSPLQIVTKTGDIVLKPESDCKQVSVCSEF